ncbi:hypothetical protein ACFSBZ_05660 [Amnibacterium flavum]|uniref:4-hydroxybenzoate polyprenyltransferase n=1 Tax=Amnibacterium flavum TaxID=2173173 RepID=A0A2V1HN38_9MICO|nr:hypothetical protein [Amnibacterium flavum]PVZ94043.1 hypothetical protein DDQ50_09820 [Amnibacterium flavum]
MSLSLTALVTAAAEEANHVELPMPTFVYGLIALVAFAALAIVVWSYRNVANRHSQVSGAQGGDGSGHGSAHGG